MQQNKLQASPHIVYVVVGLTRSIHHIELNCEGLPGAGGSSFSGPGYIIRKADIKTPKMWGIENLMTFSW